MRTRLALTLAAAITASVALATGTTVALATGTVGTYGAPGATLNGGIYAGPCVVELWGTPGIGCHGNG